MFLRLLQDEKMRTVLRDKYGLTQMAFYEIAAKPILFEETVTKTPASLQPFVAPIKKGRPGILSWLRRRFI